MKKFTFAISALLLIVITLTQCNKDQTFQTYIYTSADSSETKLNLFIDDENKGAIPFLNGTPACETDSLEYKTLYLILKSGKHSIQAKDAQGNVKSSSIIKLKKNGMSAESKAGGIETKMTNNCLIMRVYF